MEEDEEEEEEEEEEVQECEELPPGCCPEGVEVLLGGWALSRLPGGLSRITADKLE